MKLRVRAAVINEGTSSQEYVLFTEEGDYVHYQPRWKTKKGAQRWAEKHDLEFYEE